MSKIFSSDENHLGSLKIHIKKKKKKDSVLRALVIVTVEVCSKENLFYFRIIFLTVMPDALNRSVLQIGSKISSVAGNITVVIGIPLLKISSLSY